MKAIIPVAGLGTRLLPATKAIPKEMLPIVDKPLIQYIVHEIASAGVKEIVLVTHASKNAIENHFDTQFELEATLEKRTKRLLLDNIKKITPPDVKIMHIRQGRALGLGHAIYMAHPIVGDDDFIVVLPDMLIDDASTNSEQVNLKAMIQQFQKTGKSQVMVGKVSEADVSKFGIAALTNRASTIEPGRHAGISKLVEKPNKTDAPSRLAIMGRYVLTREIWPYLSEQKPGAQDEIQFTDALEAYLNDNGTLEAYTLVGDMYDCGNKLGFAKANLAYAMKHPELQHELRSFASHILATHCEHVR